LTEQIYVDMIMDILSERGYHVSVDTQTTEIPKKINLESGQILTESVVLHIFTIRFKEIQIRGVFGNLDDSSPRYLANDISDTETPER
jgi:adenylate kinase